MGACFSSERGRSGNARARRGRAEWPQIIVPTGPSEPVIPGGAELAQAPRTDHFIDKDYERYIRVKEFTYEELHVATNGFQADRFLGQGGFGAVYKGFLDHDSTNQEVAIKKLNLLGEQGNEEFVTELLILSNVHHTNLVKLVGYCAKQDQRILVYEYLPLGSLNSHIHDLPSGQQPLDWSTRIKILLGAAKGLEHLHDHCEPPVINRDVKCANILLGEGYHPKLSDFGLAKLGPTGDDTHVSTRVMGTPGYCAPEYLMTGRLTFKTDIYSFGVVMLEVLTGRMAEDERIPGRQRNLVIWARELLGRQDFSNLVDPALRGQCSEEWLDRAFVVASTCINESPHDRPHIRDVVASLTLILESGTGSRRRRLNRGGPSTPTRTSSDGKHQGEGQGEGSSDGNHQGEGQGEGS